MSDHSTYYDRDAARKERTLSRCNARLDKYRECSLKGSR